MTPQQLHALFPVYNTGHAISYIATSILTHMQRAELAVRLWVPASDQSAKRPFIKSVFPWWAKGLAYRTAGAGRVAAMTEWDFLRKLKPRDVAYLWPGYSQDLCRRVRAKGATLIVERINCAVATSARILRAEAEAIGEFYDSSRDHAEISREHEDLSHADFLFAPSPLAAQSFLEDGVPAEKILPASYGWGKDRITLTGTTRPSPGGNLRLLFVGSIGFRKGVHRLLDAWKAAGISGELVLAGGVEPAFAARWGHRLRDPGVRHIGYVTDIGSLYRSVDVFVFPSFEEGGPLVSYEAMASGLPCVLSPMGAGAVARDGLDAIVLQPQNVEAWASAFRRLSTDPQLRAEMGQRAAERASEFTWERCASARITRLYEAGVLQVSK